MAGITNVSPVASYLSALKDEDLAASNYVKSDVATKQAIASFEKKHLQSLRQMLCSRTTLHYRWFWAPSA